MVEMFWIWDCVIVTWVIFVKIHHAAHLRYVHFVARKLYPSKAQLACKGGEKKPVQSILVIHGSYVLEVTTITELGNPELSRLGEIEG